MSRVYLNTAKAIRAVENGKSLKQYYGTNKMGKEEYALACETLKYRDVLERLFRNTQVNGKTLDVDEHLLKVMVYELFFGKKKIQGGGVVKRKIMENYEKLESFLKAELEEKGKDEYNQLQSDEVIQASNLPKYIRINPIKISVDSGFRELQSKFPTAEFDMEIPSLVKILPPYSGIGDLDNVLNGKFIIQDKASCFPSQILFDEWWDCCKSGDFADACAAPGNKTSHLAGLLWDIEAQRFVAKVSAFDRNESRCELLRSRMSQANATNVVVSCENFLEVDSNLEIYAQTTSILVDPSCSGSGVIRSLERVVERSRPSLTEDKDRLEKLAQFQVSVVTKALSFPAVRQVVYSTCSIHQEENEDVVVEILKNHPNWELKSPRRMTKWPRKGLNHPHLSSAQSQCLIRCHPEDGMNGFFVALFVKKNSIPSETRSMTRVESENFQQKRSFESLMSNNSQIDSPRRKIRRRIFWTPYHKYTF